MPNKVKSILVWFLQATKNHEFESHQIEAYLPDAAFKLFRVRHSPGTYSRKFRELKKEGTERYGFILEDHSDLYPMRKEITWFVKPYDPEEGRELSRYEEVQKSIDSN